MKPIVSLCMPTNGVIEWVFPVLESIYSQGIKEYYFEVVITDNGDNREFKDKIRPFIEMHENILYFETDALPFVNEIESYKRANGTLIKFVNHRTKLVDGALKRLIKFASKNVEDKPIIYFSNGVLNKHQKRFVYDTFDDFVRNLSYWSSWSTGMTIWKDDLEMILGEKNEFNELFPHTDILFAIRKRDKYVIDNSVIFDEIPQGRKPKGDYDLFYAFGIEYPWIISNLLRDNSITNKTYRKVIDDNGGFIASLYYEYVIQKMYCSYDLSGLKNIYGVYYMKSEILTKVTKLYIKIAKSKMYRR